MRNRRSNVLVRDSVVLLNFTLFIHFSAQGNSENSCDKVTPVEVLLTVHSTDTSNETYFGVLASFGGNLPVGSPELQLKFPSPEVVCSPDPSTQGAEEGDASNGSGGICGVVRRGGCSFVTLAVAAQLRGDAAVIVVNNQQDVFAMGCGERDPSFGNLSSSSSSSDGVLTIPAIMVSNTTGQALMHARSVVVSVAEGSGAVGGSLDPMIGVLLGIAVLTITIGAHWAAYDTHSALELDETGEQTEGAATQVEVFQVTETMASMFVFAASAFLLVLFFFSKYISFIVIGVFSLGAVVGVYQTLLATLPLLATLLRKHTKFSLQSRGVSVAVHSTFVATGVVLATTWILCRHHFWCWTLQDLLGMVFLVVILRSTRLPSLRVAALLLSTAFLYDVFWVFLQPLLTHSQSVMIHVAAGGAKHEPLPLALKVPHFSASPSWDSGIFDQARFSILGYGDVVLPGMLAVLMKQFDVFTFSRPAAFGYFTWCLVGYVVGMGLTFLALQYNVGGRGGQPALLYLVPCTLGSTLLLAWCRGELGSMWTGTQLEDATGSNPSSPSTGDVEFGNFASPKANTKRRYSWNQSMLPKLVRRKHSSNKSCAMGDNTIPVLPSTSKKQTN